MIRSPLVIFAHLGRTMDQGTADSRWERWRPTVDLHRHEDLLIQRLELIIQPDDAELAEVVVGDIGLTSPETEVRLNSISLVDPWDLEEVYGALYDFVRAYDFDTDKERYAAHITTGSHVQQICLYLLTETRFIPGVLVQSSPPAQWRHGGVGTYNIIDLDLSKYDQLAARFAADRVDASTYLKSGIQTRNPAFNALIEQVEHVAIHSADPILLMGPTGAGKSHLGKRIYELKKARHKLSGRFIEVNCATIRGETAMSTLFGHKKGAFTGAATDRPGLLRTANEGVLFLDEIGELGPDEQAMLLRALEEKRFLPLGADQEVESDFQLIAGTNRDLATDLTSGTFREDLLARIDTWSFYLPGLAERREDIPGNLDHELNRLSEELGRRVAINAEAKQRFLDFSLSTEATWDRNFRDFNASLRRLATLAGPRRINRGLVNAEIERLKRNWTHPRPTASPRLSEFLTLDSVEAIDPFDRPQLAYVLEVCANSTGLSDAGRKLFSVSRTKRKSSNDADRLRKYLARYGLEWGQIHQSKV